MIVVILSLIRWLLIVNPLFREEQGRFDVIRHYIAKIVLELDKKNKRYQFAIGNYLYLLAKHLLPTSIIL